MAEFTRLGDGGRWGRDWSVNGTDFPACTDCLFGSISGMSPIESHKAVVSVQLGGVILGWLRVSVKKSSPSSQSGLTLWGGLPITLVRDGAAR